MLCTNAGVYPVEAKFRETDLISAIAKVQNDYIKYYKILGIKGGFAILYPEELARPMPIDVIRDLAVRSRFRLIAMFPPEDSRPFKVYEGSLFEAAKILAQHILTPPRYVEPSIDYIIKSLRESALYILNGLRSLAGVELKDFFGGRDVFRNILQYEEEKYPVEELRSATAYLLVNQLLFYHVLSKLRPDELEEIDPDIIQNPSDLKRYFERIQNINYKMIYSYDVASLIPSKFVEDVRTIINVIKGISAEKVGGDLLGIIFHDLIPFEVRKYVAAFYTNVLAAELLASLSIDKHDAKVADFAVGSGGLLVAAYRRKRSLLKEPFTEEHHRRFVEEDLLGVDVMPFAANVAGCHIALQSPQYFTNKVNIAIWDPTELEPGRTIPSMAGQKFVLKGQAEMGMFMEPQTQDKGVISLTGEEPEEIKLETYDVVIMNPPFTRQERIPEDYKKILLERFTNYKGYLHGQLGYYGYFILLADRFLKEKGRMALVLPATVLRVKSCEGLRRLWSEKYHVEHIITTWHRSAFSESVRFREMLFVARKSRASNDARTVITVLKRLPKTLAEAREIAEQITHSLKDWEDDRMIVKVHEHAKLQADIGNWFKNVAISDLSLIDLMKELLKSDKLRPFSSIGIEAQRVDLEHLKFKDFLGFILLDKSRVQKKTDVWVLERIEGDVIVAKHRGLGREVEVPINVLGRGLRRLSYVQTMDVSEISDYLILSWFKGLKDMAKDILTDKELEIFGESDVRVWRDKFDHRKSNVLFARRFDLSAPGTSLLAFYSDIPVIGVDMWCIRQLEGERAKVLTSWLNSTLCLLQILICRTETRGAWMKVHNYMLGDMLIPDYDKLSKLELKHLLEVFESVKGGRFPSLMDQLRKKHQSRRIIDKAWLKVLGYKGNADTLLDRLYISLANEIDLLKRLMAEEVPEELEEESE